MAENLQESRHGLESTDGAEVNAVLERRHRHESACRNAFPIRKQAAVEVRHVDNFCRIPRQNQREERNRTKVTFSNAKSLIVRKVG